MDRLPITSLHMRMFYIIAASEFFSGFILYAPASLVVSAYKTLHFTPSVIPLILSAAGIGTLAGAIVFSYLSDALGRRLIFQFDMLFLSLGSLAMAFSVNWQMLFITLVIASIGSGGFVGVDNAYLAEYFPSNTRGKWMTFTLVLFSVGQMLANGIFAASAILPNFWAWRLIPIIGFSGAFFAWAARRTLPESVRYLILKGESEEAEKVATKFERAAGPSYAYSGTRVIPKFDAKPKADWKKIFSRQYLKYTVTLFSGFFVVDLLLSFNAYLPVVFTRGLGGSSSLGTLSTLIIIEVITGTFLIYRVISSFIIDKLGRKFVQLLGYSVCALGLVLWAYPWTHRTSVSIFYLLIPGLMFGFWNFWLMGYNVTAADVYPAESRSQGLGYGSAAGRVGATIGPFIFAAALSNITILFYTYAALAFLVFLMTWAWIPETRRQSIEVSSREKVETIEKI